MAKSVKDSRIMEQKDTISQLNMVISSQNELIASLRSTVEECNATISSLREQVEYLTKKLFGTSSEKSKMVAGQLNLFDEAEQEAQLPEEEASGETAIKEHTRNARRTNKETFKGVPSRDEVIPLSDEQRRCVDCGSEMDVIGTGRNSSARNSGSHRQKARLSIFTVKQQNAPDVLRCLPWPGISSL